MSRVASWASCHKFLFQGKPLGPLFLWSFPTKLLREPSSTPASRQAPTADVRSLHNPRGFLLTPAPVHPQKQLKSQHF